MSKLQRSTESMSGSGLVALGLSCVLTVFAAASVHAEDPKPKPAPKPSGPSCKLENEESPRGGRLDVTGERFGAAPVVRIAGTVARILERREGHISVQVSASSNGGPVTIQADGKTADCGTLVIIGKDRE